MTDLTAIRDSLEGLTDIDLKALAITTNDCPQIAPGLLAWIEGACDWEINRRQGFTYVLQPPEAAIDPSEDAVSIEATNALRESFAGSGVAPEALKFFDALAAILTGSGQKH